MESKCQTETGKKNQWESIVGYEGIYEVDKNGNVKSIKSGKMLKPQINIWGYVFYHLSKNGKAKNVTSHRIVATAFISNPLKKPCINHKDGNKLNNRIENLEWVTYSENEIHSCKVLGKKPYQPMKGKFGKDHNRSKPVNQYDLSGNFIKRYHSRKMASDETGANASNIGSCIDGTRTQAGGYKWRNG